MLGNARIRPSGITTARTAQPHVRGPHTPRAGWLTPTHVCNPHVGGIGPRSPHTIAAHWRHCHDMTERRREGRDNSPRRWSRLFNATRVTAVQRHDCCACHSRLWARRHTGWALTVPRRFRAPVQMERRCGCSRTRESALLMPAATGRRVACRTTRSGCLALGPTLRRPCATYCVGSARVSEYGWTPHGEARTLLLSRSSWLHALLASAKGAAFLHW